MAFLTALFPNFYRMIPIRRPCGYRSDPRRACSCMPPQVDKHLSKISGPLLDRIDLRVEVPAVQFTRLAEMPPGPGSADLRREVLEGGGTLGEAVCNEGSSGE